MIEIPIRNRAGAVLAHALVDDDDVRVARHRWSFDQDGYVVAAPRRGLKLRLHREVLGLASGNPLEADHISGDKLDNRRANLCPCTRAQNGQNVAVRPGSASRHRGVYFQPDPRRAKRWRARVAGVHIGYFATEDEAGVAVDAWMRVHMPFAVLERCHAAA